MHNKNDKILNMTISKHSTRKTQLDGKAIIEEEYRALIAHLSGE